MLLPCEHSSSEIIYFQNLIDAENEFVDIFFFRDINFGKLLINVVTNIRYSYFTNDKYIHISPN